MVALRAGRLEDPAQPHAEPRSALGLPAALSRGAGPLAFFNPNATNPITNSPGQLQYAGNRGADISCQCRTPVKTYWKNFGPRLGLEWSMDPKTVLRAGFAVAYSRAGGVGGRAGDSTGTGQTGFGSSIVLPPAVNTDVGAGPSYYLNN